MNSPIIQSGELFDGRYKIIKPLSKEGGTADVWLARDINTIDENLEDGESLGRADENTGMLVAIKTYRPKNALDIEGEQMFRDEYKIVYDCRHTNLLQPTDFAICGDTPYLVLPFCERGSSQQLVGQQLPEDEIWRYIHDVASGLAYLHSNTPEIIHQDIKPGNILIDKRGNYVITDFGISTQQGRVQEDLIEKQCGTFAYMAPERFNYDAPPARESDIWSVGATVFEIITGTPPFGEGGGGTQIDGTPLQGSLSGVSSSLAKLIEACLAVDPQQRPTAAVVARAAELHTYPVPANDGRRGLRPLHYILMFVVALVAAAAAWFLRPHDVSPEPEVINADSLYQVAMQYMDQAERDSMQQGLIRLEKLDSLNYVPAIFELAKTYGKYDSPTSRHRKAVLGIATDSTGVSPTENRYNESAMSALKKIVSLRDSSYAKINGRANLMVAEYYLVRDNTFRRNYDEARPYLDAAAQWATMATDQAVIEAVEEHRRMLEQN